MSALAYTTVSVTGYNANPPDDDGTQASSNEVEWQKHLDKIGAPLKTAIETTQTNVAAAVTALKGAVEGFLFGMQTSPDSGDADNDANVTAGSCVDTTGAYLLALATEITKRADANWAVGDDQGGDDGTLNSTGWNFIHAIYRSDTGVTDVLLSGSATSPTLPTNYDAFRPIGVFFRSSGVNLPWRQEGDTFINNFDSSDIAGSYGTSTSARALRTIFGAPTGIRTRPILSIFADITGDTAPFLFIGSPDLSGGDDDVAVAGNYNATASGVAYTWISPFETNTSRQLNFTITVAGFSDLDIFCTGFIWQRGRKF